MESDTEISIIFSKRIQSNIKKIIEIQKKKLIEQFDKKNQEIQWNDIDYNWKNIGDITR